MYKLGLTGSIGMGKSTTLEFFRALGCPVWDADAAVHRLYSKGGPAVPAIQEIAPSAIVDRSVDRVRLKSLLHSGDLSLADLERIVHPLVSADREQFAADCTAPICVFDIPLLYEIGAQDWFDGVAVVSVDAETQRARVLERPGMTVEQLDLILSRQMPDSEKRSRADFVIETKTRDAAAEQVKQIVQEIQRAQDHA